MQWLTAGCQPGDSLFFHFSGHGSQQADSTGLEADGFDETILPLDFRHAGEIVDDEVIRFSRVRVQYINNIYIVARLLFQSLLL